MKTKLTRKDVKENETKNKMKKMRERKKKDEMKGKFVNRKCECGNLVFGLCSTNIGGRFPVKYFIE